ncbi:MAG TPA: phosphate ABC transporter ATP-binding protein [Methermicoccus shengliensis]|uniref:Phosphate ABC transporter ATP-binding protein n=2 Tax=Methermicoccus shengliensis TaxID=660064 RepID=A0A832VXC1_9EURY|nr:MAG: Phosphate ABC transporter ATP-binding protein, PhoT family [Euryarchaeota archaeon 55_53]KUK30851.1 MAG: Phosphate ABC transporter ATP-binding protein, PhoT family [Methanosarcinales archeaon 56_1174]MDN5294534.1 UDP-glucose/iron transport system ATP-binding protein [Methanosarcinales archaeon]HIH69737.1 phosphate ABC transporter ATP-binding protein [Methermicoccus shengliensis]
MIQMLNVRKSFGGKEVLKGVSLSVKRGCVMAITGPSGSGKSTLLRCINRLTELDEGDILVDGISIRDYNPVQLRRKVGMVFQFPVMLEGSVRDNIAYGLRLLGREEGVERLAREVGVEDLLDNDATRLSGGEQQRVAIARALALKPKTMLFDEPTASLDNENVIKIESLVMKLVKSKGLTVLWVTHDFEQAKRLGHRIAVMRNGRVAMVEHLR